MALSGDAFHRAILTSSPSDRPNVLTQFKTHVKKDNVDLASVPKYFEALAIAMKLLNPELQSLAFSLVSHLVKRVSIQDRRGTILVNVAPVVLPIVIPKLADVRSSMKLSARRALEAYWLSAPEQTERAVVELGLESGPLLANESVVWLNSLLLINANIDLHPYFQALVQILSHNPNDGKLVSNIKILFANYFDLKHNSLHKFDLQKILEATNVSTTLRTSIIGTDAALLRKYETRNKMSHNISILSASSIAVLAPKLAPKPAPVQTPKPVIEANPNSESLNENKELVELLNSLTGYQMEEGIKPAILENEEELLHIFSSVAPCFEGKETEKNWNLREKAINRIRTLLRADVSKRYPHTFFLAIKDASEMICKGLLSLRTSLCLNSCQLVKELALFLHNEFLVLFDLFWPTLLRLCSNTKHLTSINAHIVVSAIFANTILTTKSAQKIFLSSKEKSASVRSYSAFWLQIYMLRTCKLWPVPPSCEVMESVLLKLLPDPNVQVRQAAKDAFWRYYILAVDAATVLESRLDSNTVKALERSRPKSCMPAAPVVNVRNTRPSIKEAIIAKNRELRNQQTISRSNSRNGFCSRTPSFPMDASIENSSNATITNGNDSHANKFSNETKGESSLYHFVSGNSHLGSALSNRGSGVRSSTLHETKQPSTVPPASYAPKGFNDLPALESSTSFAEADSDSVAVLLASKGTRQLENGVRMLSKLFFSEMPIAPKLQSLITLVSITHPYLFSAILLDKTLSKELVKCLSAEDFLRTCFVTIAEPDKCFNVVSSHLAPEQICDSINFILGHICNMDDITGNKPLVMQLIKYKGTILAILIDVLTRVTTSESCLLALPKMLTILFGLVPIVYQTHIIDSYRILLQGLYDKDREAFSSQLDLATSQNQKEVYNLLGLGPKVTLAREDAVTLNPSEFTLIAPGAAASSFLPLKHPSDFTMLFPSKLNSSKEALNSIAKEGDFEGLVKMESDFESPEKIMTWENPSGIEDINQVPITNEAAYTNDNSSTNNETSKDESIESIEKSPNPIPDPSSKDPERSFQNIFAKSDSKAMNSDFVAKLNSDQACDLVEDFAQVKLSNFSNSIESFIEKVDPLNRMATRSRPITIFEDPKGGSPQKAKDYSYTEFNWFNFLIARLSVTGDSVEEKESISIICHDMERGLLTNSQLSTLLKTLQINQKSNNTLLAPPDFAMVEASLFAYLEVPSSDKLIGLMVLKQLLVCRYQMNLKHVWAAVVSVCGSIASDNDQEYVLELALREVFIEMLCGMYSSAELFLTIFSTLHNSSHHLDQLLQFLVEALSQLLESNTLVLLVTEELVFKLDTVLRPFLNHDSARIRKATFKTYGLFLRACKAIDKTTENPNGQRPPAYHCMLDIMQSLTTPDKKLIEYYSND